MKDFAGSSITYYGLARERLMNKYPRLISVLVILALICMIGLALFIISDLVSFASNSDRNGVLVGLDLKGPENGITSMTNGKEKSGNISANSENLSRQTKEQSFANLSKMNASLPSSQVAKGGVYASKSSPVIRHHSSSSSSSTSPAKSAKKSNDNNNLTNQSMNNSQRSNDSILTFLPSVAFGAITNPAKDTTAREPVSIIKFKTKATLSPKSDQGMNPDNGINTAGATFSDNSNKAQSSKNVRTKSASSQNSKVTASSQAKKTLEARAKLKANRDRIAENMKKKAAQSRAKAAQK
jgi:hypothetical protein